MGIVVGIGQKPILDLGSNINLAFDLLFFKKRLIVIERLNDEGAIIDVGGSALIILIAEIARSLAIDLYRESHRAYWRQLGDKPIGS